MEMITAGEVRIPLSEIEFTYARSSGPGGQNVNKVNSKAVLRWNPLSSSSLSDEMRFRLASKLQDRLTSDGDLVLMSDRFRDQGKNRDDCLEKLQALIATASARPKHRKKTRPTFSSKKRKREAKSRQSDKKESRRKSW